MSEADKTPDLAATLEKDFSGLNATEFAAAQEAITRVVQKRDDEANGAARAFENKVRTCSDHELNYYQTWGKWPNE